MVKLTVELVIRVVPSAAYIFTTTACVAFDKAVNAMGEDAATSVKESTLFL
jgi:hypothetical protein